MDVGVGVTAQHVLTLFALCGLLLRGVKRPISSGVTWFIPLLCYTVGWTVIASGLLEPTHAGELAGGKFRAELRMLTQLVKFVILDFGFVWCVAQWIRLAPENSVIALKSFALGCVLLAAFGLLQVGAVAIGLEDPMPIEYRQVGPDRSALYQIADQSLVRLSSLGGEPKGTASILLVGLVLLFLREGFGRSTWAVILAIVLTLSTGGLLLLAVVLTLLVASQSGVRRVLKQLSVFMLMVAATAIAFSDELLILYEWRFAGLQYGFVEDFDVVIISFLKDNPWAWPFGVGYGLVHLHAAPYIPPELDWLMSGTVFVAKSGYLKLVSEGGLVGLVTFLLPALWVLKRKRSSTILLAGGLLLMLLLARQYAYYPALLGLTVLSATPLGKDPLRD